MTNDLIVTFFEGTVTTDKIIDTYFWGTVTSNELINTFLWGQVTSNEIIVIFSGWPVTSSEIIVIFLGSFNEVIVTFFSTMPISACAKSRLTLYFFQFKILTRTKFLLAQN